MNPLQPLVNTIRHYNVRKLRKDVVAGLTVSVVEVPQAMAYALVAGVPPQYGLYTSIIQGVIGALLSSSEHLTTGPTNTQSLLIASAAARVAQVSPTAYLQLVFGLTLIKGLIQLAFAAAKLGDLVRYVSRSVIVGVAAGSGVLIAVGQLPNFLGVVTEQTHHLPGVLGAFERLAPHVGQANGRAILLGVICVTIMVAMRQISRFVPAALIAVVLSAAAVAVLGWIDRIPVVGELPRAFPTFEIPQIGWSDAHALFGGALALAVLGMLESVAIAKSIAAHTGERISANQEFFTQGLNNFATSFFQCIPGSGSFTRSALDWAAGAESRFAAVFNGLFVAMIFWVLADEAKLIPLASLAAVLFVIAYGLIDWRYILRIMRSSRSDALVCFATIAATLLAPLEFAIFIGIFLNIALYLRAASRLHMAEMVQTPGGPFMERPIHDRSGEKKVIFLQLEGELFFGVADELQDQLGAVARCGVRVVILRLKRTHSIDATVLHVIEGFARDMKRLNRYVILCGVKFDLLDKFRKFGLVDVIGRENIFETGGGVFTSAKRALERARQLAGSSLDAAGIDMNDEPEEFVYRI